MCKIYYKYWKCHFRFLEVLFKQLSLAISDARAGLGMRAWAMKKLLIIKTKWSKLEVNNILALKMQSEGGWKLLAMTGYGNADTVIF
jgi:hypothetical protein